MSELDTLSSSRVSTNGDHNALLQSVIHQDSRARLYSDLRRKIMPAEVRGILAQALQGNLFWQSELFRIQLETWPRLQGALR
jgi:hypothetical protein